MIRTTGAATTIASAYKALVVAWLELDGHVTPDKCE